MDDSPEHDLAFVSGTNSLDSIVHRIIKLAARPTAQLAYGAAFIQGERIGLHRSLSNSRLRVRVSRYRGSALIGT